MRLRRRVLPVVALVALTGVIAPACSAHLPKAPPPPNTDAATTTTSTTQPTTSLPTSTASSGKVPGTSTTSTTTTTTTTAIPPAATTTVPPPATVAYAAEAHAAYGVGPLPTNWDIHSTGASAYHGTLAQVLAQVWPSAFVTTTSGGLMMNSALLRSATQASPTTVVYELNPKAVWSDGRPITYEDFRYNWQAQSGRSRFVDVGGAPFTARSHAGYDRITSVSGSPADPFRVTVTFSSSFPAWRSLFSYLLPAHVAKAVGFDRGFTNPGSDLVSGGAFMVSSYQPGYSLTLVRNSRYWGRPANLAGVTYYFSSSPAQEVGALAQGELDVATLPASAAAYQALGGAAGGMTVKTVAGATYEDLVMRMANPVLRRAVQTALDRPSMAGAVLSAYGLSATPVQNRYLLPGAPGYQANGAAFGNGDVGRARSLLSAAGYRLQGGELLGPNGTPVALSLVIDQSDPEAAQLAAMVKSACAGLGIAVTISPLPGSPSSESGWEIAVEQVPLGTFVATPGPVIAARLAEIPSTAPSALPALYNGIDQLAWASAVDLPLVGVPQLVVYNPKLLNVLPGPYVANLAFNEQEWGFAAS